MRSTFRYHRWAGLRSGWRRGHMESHCRAPSSCAFRGGSNPLMVRVMLPYHLRRLAGVDGEIKLEVEGQVTQRSILDALEARYPVLCGTIRDHVTQQRRPFLRFFACEQDLSHDSPDTQLPDAVATGAEPFLIIGAIAGG